MKLPVYYLILCMFVGNQILFRDDDGNLVKFDVENENTEIIVERNSDVVEVCYEFIFK